MLHPVENRCALWGTPAETGRASSFVYQFVSARAGGPYTLDLLAFNRMPKQDPELYARLTTWLVDQRRGGDEWPFITAEVLDRALKQQSLRLSDRVERFFLYLNSLRLRPGAEFLVDGSEQSSLPHIAAWTESRDEDDALHLLELLESMALLRRVFTGAYTLTPDGFGRLEAAGAHSLGGRQCFVAMWFGEEMDIAYHQGISLGISDAGFTPFRIDSKEHANKIDDEIVAEIRRSRFMVADFTCPTIVDGTGETHPDSRGGVYFEAGLAQGLRLPVIWTVRSDCLKFVHFDTRQYAHIVWADPEDLRVRLRNRIGAIIGGSTS